MHQSGMDIAFLIGEDKMLLLNLVDFNDKVSEVIFDVQRRNWLGTITMPSSALGHIAA